LARRFKQSGKDKLIVLAMTDLDPDGDIFPQSLGRRLRDDHSIDNIEVFKVALTIEQVRDPRVRVSENVLEAKEKSPNYKRYVRLYETDQAWELEAVPPRTLQQLLEQHIKAQGVLDLEAFNKQVEEERKEHERNEVVRERVVQTLREQSTR
jgi:hypothetical protein